MSELASVICPHCERLIKFKKAFLDDPKAVSYCRNPNCFYVFYPATGKQLRTSEFEPKQFRRDCTLGSRPDRGISWLDEVRPQNVKVPCPECGNYFHQTKRLDRMTKFKCPRCDHEFVMDPRKCVGVPSQMAHPPRSRGISPDRVREKQELRYVTRPCPSCEKDVRFVEALLQAPNHVVGCKTCLTLFNPVTNEIVSPWK